MGQSEFGVGLIGFGTVGTGVAQLLADHADVYTQRTGKKITLKRVLVRDTSKARDMDLEGGLVTSNPDEFFATEGMGVVIELAGGVSPADDYFRRALTSGRHVVTANKSLLAAQGPELFALARKNKLSIAFEASCGGGIPIINALQFGMASNRIERLYGILNGTCNYILSQMTSAGKSYAEALAEALARGFAEADPTLDVSGADAAQKLAVLATLAFGVRATAADVDCEGIQSVDLTDIQTGRELGYELKLLAIAEMQYEGLSLRVHPCFIATDKPLAQVHGSFNALSAYGDAVGHTFYYGRGAGRFPTASAVVSDLLSIVTGWYPKAFASLRSWPDQATAPQFIDRSLLQTRYYIRLMALDRPGVLGQITGILGQHEISIASVIQHEANDGQFVPMILTTHAAKDGSVRQATKLIESMNVVDGPVRCMRIVDPPRG